MLHRAFSYVRVTGLWLAAIAAAMAVVLSGMIAFGTVAAPPPLASISDPFRAVDFSQMPPLRRLALAQGSPVAYRHYPGRGKYPGESKGVAILLHGSTALSNSLHPLAQGLQAAGVTVYVPDIRGHGATGTRGDVDFRFQPDADLIALIAHIRAENPGQPLDLAGFSLGGGFALRFLGANPTQPIERLLLLAPALGPQSTALRVRDDPWAAPHLPRILALSILNRFGVTAFNGLEAIRYAVEPGSEAYQTAAYSYRLLFSLLPEDHTASLRALKVPTTVLVGEADELFAPAALRADLGAAANLEAFVVPGVNHIGLTLAPKAQARIMDWFTRD